MGGTALAHAQPTSPKSGREAQVVRELANERIRFQHSIRETTQGVLLMAEEHGSSEEFPRDLATVMERLLITISDQSEDRGRQSAQLEKSKAHPLALVNMIALVVSIIPLIWASGMLYQRILTLEQSTRLMEERVNAMRAVEAITPQMTEIKSQMQRLEDRVNRILERQTSRERIAQ